MFKYLSLFIVVVFVFQVPQVSASSVDAVLLKIDALVLELELLKKEVQKLKSGSAAPTGEVAGASASAIFTESLEYGVTNDDIAKIQKLLATDPEIYPYGVSSGFFGPKTQEAIRNLQTHFGLDPVGVIGPATTALLEGYLRQYPDGNYPADIFSAKPTVAGATTSVTPSSVTPTPSVSVGSNPAKSIYVVLEMDEDEALITVNYTDGRRKGYIANTTDEEEVINYIAAKASLTKPQVEAVIDFDYEDTRKRRSSDDNDEDDAEDALDDADDAIDDARREINLAEDDGDDIDWAEDTLDDAKDALEEAEEAFDDEDWDEAAELAEDAENLARKAEDRIDEEEGSKKGDEDDIESIEVDVDEGESDVTVEYGDGDEYEFTVEEDKESAIIEEIADELNIDEDDVEDVIEFEYGRIDRIEVRISEETSLARVFYDSGVERRVRMNETDEDDIIEELADELDEDEEDIEDIIDFD